MTTIVSHASVFSLLRHFVEEGSANAVRGRPQLLAPAKGLPSSGLWAPRVGLHFSGAQLSCTPTRPGLNGVGVDAAARSQPAFSRATRQVRARGVAAAQMSSATPLPASPTPQHLQQAERVAQTLAADAVDEDTKWLALTRHQRSLRLAEALAAARDDWRASTTQWALTRDLPPTARRLVARRFADVATRQGVDAVAADQIAWESKLETVLAPLHPAAAQGDTFRALADALSLAAHRSNGMTELLARLAHGRAAGTLQPLTWHEANETQRNMMLEMLSGVAEVQVVALLAGLVLQIDTATFIALPYVQSAPAMVREQGQALLATLQNAAPELIEFIAAGALGHVPAQRWPSSDDASALALRLELARTIPDEGTLQSWWRRAEARMDGLSPALLTQLWEERLACPLADEARQRLLDAMAGRTTADFAPDRVRLRAALQMWADAEQGHLLALTEVITWIDRQPASAARHALIAEVLDMAWRLDAQRAAPLHEWVAPAQSAHSVWVERTRLDVCDVPDRDLSAVPPADLADLILTPTTRQTLQATADAWRLRRPTLLEGPTSAGKTAAVRYLAWKTGTPYRRINLSYYSDVSDLVGRRIGGDRRYSEADLQGKTDDELRSIARQYLLDASVERSDLITAIWNVQRKGRWVDGPLTTAMKRGEVVVLDEMNLARAGMLERLNSLLDDRGNLLLIEHDCEVVTPHKHFRLFATMNPAKYAGRTPLSEANLSRWEIVQVPALTQADLTEIMTAKYGDLLPAPLLMRMLSLHQSFSAVAESGDLGRASGGLAFTNRDLFKVAERFKYFRGRVLNDEEVLTREMGEVYLDKIIDPDDTKRARQKFRSVLPKIDMEFYKDITVQQFKHGVQIADLFIRNLNTGHSRVPTRELVMTPRTVTALYKLAKAVELDKNVILIGDRASGKTALVQLYARLRGQPCYEQPFSSSTDTMQLIGYYDPNGWQDGLLLRAARPEAVPGILLADEFNLGSPEALERFNSVLDDERMVVLSEKEGERVTLHHDFRLVATMNPPTRRYADRRKLSPAMQNRFTQIVVTPVEDADELREIASTVLRQKNPGAADAVNDTLARALVDLHVWVVQAYQDGQLGKELLARDKPVFSLRQLLAAVDRIAEFGHERGYVTALCDAATVYTLRATGDDRVKMDAHLMEVAAGVIKTVLHAPWKPRLTDVAAESAATGAEAGNAN